MARCIAFPPPEYVQNGVSGAALSELIKLRREERVASEKRREKEKKRRKKEQEEELEEGEIRERKCTHKHKKAKKYGGAGDCGQMNRESENQLLERSSLTEELQLPISDSLYDSSDSSRNRKHHCCSFARTSFLVQDKPEFAPAFVSSEACLQCVESQYRELTVNWVPPPFQIEHHEFDDQEWLFERKFLRSNMTEICKAWNDDLISGHGNSSLHPCAQHLPQADICALPYTTLF